MPRRFEVFRRPLPGHRPAHRAFAAPSMLPSALGRGAALLAVGAIGMTALSATTATQRLSASATRPGASGPDVSAVLHLRSDVLESPPFAGVRRVETASPEPVVLRPRAVAPARPAPAPRKVVAAHKWLPTGTGMWIYQWGKSNGGKPDAVVKRAKAVGLTHLFIRTGSSHDGFTGAPVLRAVLPAARAAHLQVIAWDFPELDHPVSDALRLAQAARFVLNSGARVAAVAPDIETPAEGTSSTPGAVRAYLKALRAHLPAHVAILTTVPWPSSSRVGRYPYAAVAAHSDALLPMAYWYNNSPAAVTASSITYLRQFHRPVMPVGQGYDSAVDVPSLPHSNLKAQVPSFFSTAHKLGAPAVSLWSWQSAPGATWGALKRASRLFPAER